MVTQLAMAHERQLIKKGSKIKITVSNCDDLIVNPGQSGTNSEEGATIKLQILESGTDKFKDLDFSSSDNPFSLPS